MDLRKGWAGRREGSLRSGDGGAATTIAVTKGLAERGMEATEATEAEEG